MLALISTHGLTDCSCLDLARVQIVHARAAMRIVHAHTGRGRTNARISIRDGRRGREVAEPSRASHDDLVQVACLGLVKAVDRFDPERGLRFSSFAVPTIQGELRRYLRDRTWRLHVPRALQEWIVALATVTDAMSGELQRSPTVAELAERMRISPEDILDARQAGYSQFGHSLDEPAHEEGHESLVETIGEEDRDLTGADRGIVLKAWLAELPERQREILRGRFEQDLTQREIAERCGVSQMHASRLLRRSLEHLRELATEQESGSPPALSDTPRSGL